jgi:hypothetical protein
MNLHTKVLTTLTLSCMFSAASFAAIIPSDVVINASVSFDNSASGSFAATGTASQMATMSLTQGGIAASSAVDDLSVTGANPLSGSLQETGDGIAIDANIAGIEVDDFIDGFFFDFDFSMSNISSTTDYMLVFQIMFDNNAHANTSQAQGLDTFADSKSSITNDETGDELFFTDITSDALNGDQIAGVDVDPLTYGALLNDSGTVDFSIELNSSSSIDLFGFLELAGGFFDGADSTFIANQSLSVILLSVTNLNQPPSNVPSPSTFLIMLLGIVTVLKLRKAA